MDAGLALVFNTVFFTLPVAVDGAFEEEEEGSDFMAYLMLFMGSFFVIVFMGKAEPEPCCAFLGL